jgi:thiamine monophosphate synthase
MRVMFAAISDAVMDEGMDRNPVDAERLKLARMARQLNARAAPCAVNGLVLMTDDTLRVDWIEAVLALPRGAGVIVRARDPLVREELARRVKAACGSRGVKVLIADDIGLAHRLAMDGLHFPEKRMAAAHMARRANPRWVLSASVHGRAGVARARCLPLDFLLASPFSATQSHPGTPGLGAARLAAIIADARQPVLALGGIDQHNVAGLSPLHVAGFGLIRGWMPMPGA